jgi:hypothetical protein
MGLAQLLKPMRRADVEVEEEHAWFQRGKSCTSLSRHTHDTQVINRKLFNQVLLARQSWRLIQKQNSLCARIMKAKYYPSGNILDNVFPNDASSSWKGVEHGLDLLKQ